MVRLQYTEVRREELKKLRAPALIMLGDRDIVRVEHAAEMARLIPNAQLAVLPGADHFPGVLSRPVLVTSMVTDFLAAPMPGP